MSAPTKSCSGPCRRVLAATDRNFQRVGEGVLCSRCRKCQSARLAEVRKRTWTERRAALERAGKKRCARCRREKPLEEFARVGAGWQSYCRTCWNAWHREYRHTSTKYQRTRQAPEAIKVRREKARATYHAIKARLKRRSYARVHLHRYIKLLIKQGKLTRPTRCSKCPRGAPDFRIAAHFHNPSPVGRAFDPSRDMTWLCYPCLWRANHPVEPEVEPAPDAQALARAAVYAGGDPRAALTTSRETWLEVHDERVAALRVEQRAEAARKGGKAPEEAEDDQEAREGFLARFRASVRFEALVEAATPRPRSYADRMLAQAVGGEEAGEWWE